MMMTNVTNYSEDSDIFDFTQSDDTEDISDTHMQEGYSEDTISGFVKDYFEEDTDDEDSDSLFSEDYVDFTSTADNEADYTENMNTNPHLLSERGRRGENYSGVANHISALAETEYDEEDDAYIGAAVDFDRDGIIEEITTPMTQRRPPTDANEAVANVILSIYEHIFKTPKLFKRVLSNMVNKEEDEE